MDKIKTSRRQRPFSLKAQRSPKKLSKQIHQREFVLRDDMKAREYDPIKNLLDTDKMGAAVMQCLLENDTDGVLEIIENYLYALNKTQFLKEASIPRSTMYNMLKRGNPTIKTLAKIMHATR